MDMTLIVWNICRANQCSTSMPQSTGLGRSNAFTRGVLLGLSIPSNCKARADGTRDEPEM